MKITPIPSVVTPVIDPNGMPQQSKVDSIRSLRMTTNSTPLTNQFAPPQMPLDKTVVEATQPLSPQLALLAKQRRALQIERKEIENQRKALSQQSGTAVIETAKLKSDPLSVLLENGVTYEQLTEAIMANQGTSEMHAIKSEIESLRQGIDKKFQEREAANEQQILAEMRREATNLASDDRFELVREQRQIPNVMKLIERTYRETGEVLDVTEAMGLVEDELFKDAQKLTKLKKMQNQMSQGMAPQFQPQQRQTGMRTLTNRDTASVPLSAKARAMAAFYGTLQRR